MAKNFSLSRLKSVSLVSGIKLASSPGNNAYTIEGRVTLGEGWSHQSIRIDWQVLDPSGKKLGTVSQQNTIPKGGLNGAWGAIADAAARAAADGIIKLLAKEVTNVGPQEPPMTQPGPRPLQP